MRVRTRPVAVVHVLQQLSRGGASRSMLAAMRHATREGASTHTIVSLCPAERGGLRLATESELPVVDAPAGPALDALAAAADVVLVHYWNTPELMAFCRRCTQPVRLLLWSHVRGDMAPHLLPERIARWADRAVAAVPNAPGLPEVVLASVDFTRLDGLARRAHDGIVVGYVGTVDPVKMHPHFVRMSAAVQVPGVRFVVCGSGGGFAVLEAEAQRLGVSDRFEWRGYVEDIAAVFATTDIFGYPIVHGAGEIALQEALYAGIPAVVLKRGDSWTPVKHGRTGLIANDEAAYTKAIETLALDAGARQRLGEAAAVDARQRFDAQRSGAAFNRIFEEMMGAPKRPRIWPDEAMLSQDQTREGARAFLSLLEDHAAPFEVSIGSKDEDAVLEAETAIAGSSPMIIDAGSGGLLHYRRCFLRDPYLRLWSGLVLQRQGRGALAVAEFEAARKLGLGHWRVNRYIAAAAESIGATGLAADAHSAVAAARARSVDEPPATRPAAARS